MTTNTLRQKTAREHGIIVTTSHRGFLLTEIRFFGRYTPAYIVIVNTWALIHFTNPHTVSGNTRTKNRAVLVKFLQVKHYFLRSLLSDWERVPLEENQNKTPCPLNIYKTMTKNTINLFKVQY